MRKPEHLAVLGGQPRFAEPLHVGRPAIGDTERVLDRIRESLERRWLTNDGPFVKEFEQRICESAGANHAVAVTNATVGLQLTIRALGMTGAVMLPSFTFVATAQSLDWQGIKPIFCDVDPKTHCIDTQFVEQNITDGVSGIIGVHMWGKTCDVEGLAEIANRRNIPLLFDAAHAFGSKRKGVPVGTNGDAEVFSFHATKFVNAFEGGAITTNDDELAKKLRLMRNFGFEDYDKVIYPGTNAKMCEPAAAMGITSLESADDFLAINRKSLRQYRDRLASIPGIELSKGLIHDDSNSHYCVVEVDERKYGMSRDRLLDVLWLENVLARKYFSPGCHRISVFSDQPAPSLPITESLCNRIMQLPSGSAVTFEQIDVVCDLLQSISEKSGEINSHMQLARVGDRP